MCRRLAFLCLLVAVFGASAHAQFISAVERLNPDGNSGDTPVVLSPVVLAEDVGLFVDRTHQYNEIPEEVLGAQFVMTANDDKDNPNHILNLTISQNCTLFLVLDNRLGGAGGGLNTDPVLPAAMAWVTTMGFTDTGLDIGIDEGGDGDIDQYSSLFSAPAAPGMVSLGAQNDGGSRNMYGVLALGPKLAAYDPSPVDGSEVLLLTQTLGWRPGGTAASHDIYVGTSYDDVAAGTGGTLRAANWTLGTWYVVGTANYPYPGGLVPGTTYYWRIDEVEADGVTKHEGPVWSFIVPLQTASEPNPADGASFVDPNPTLSWKPGFQAQLHYIYWGDDYDTVANDTGADPFPLTTYELPETLEAGKTYYWRVDEFSNGQTHPGNIWSFTVAPVIPITDPNLLLWYKFDYGEGTTVPDMSGHGRHGTINGATWIEDGQVGGAIEFTGDGDEVRYADGTFLNGLTAITTSLWIKSDVIDTDKGFIIYAEPTGNDQRGIRYDADGGEGDLNLFKYGMTYTSGNEEDESPANLQSTEWQHVAVTSASGEGLKFYLNGMLIMPEEDDAAESGTITGCTIVLVGKGGKDGATASWDGLVDDVRIYDKALTLEEVQQAMRGEPDLAWNPQPGNGAEVQIADISAVSWSAGDFAVQHDVYFGTSKSAVANADTGSPEYKGRKSVTTHSVASLIEFGGGPYYWRIDEINNDSTISKGRLWRFSIGDYILIDDIEDYNNFTPDRVFETWVDGWGDSSNGSNIGYPDPDFPAGETFVETGIVHGGKQSMPFFYENNMKYSEATMTLTGTKRDWTQYGVKALSMWYYGYPASLGGITENPAGTYAVSGEGADIWGTADQFHFAWKVLNGPGVITAKVNDIIANDTDVWVKAGVMIRETLDPNSKFAGLYMTSGSGCRYQARVATAEDAVSDSSVTTLTGVQVPHWIRLERTFEGEFLGYDSNDGVNWYPLAWNPVTIQMNVNAYVGLAITSHTPGLQATAVFSNVTITGNVTGATFTNQDIGIQSNAREPMYVSIKDAQGRTATVTNTDPNAAVVTSWTEWGQYGEGIALQEFVDKTPGLNLANLDTLSIGFGTKGNNQPAGGGLVFFDDIRLYGGRCIPELAKPAADLSDNCVVDLPDLEILTDQWLDSGPDIEADLNADEIVDFTDYALMIDTWLDEVLWP